MKKTDPDLIVRFVQTPLELQAAQRLRYRVFVEELGGSTEFTDHENQLEIDQFDDKVGHLCLFDREREANDPLHSVVGVYRLITEEDSRALGGFYSEDEYNIQSLLKLSGRKLELGRSCIDPAYRGGAAMAMLWSALGEYVHQHEIEYLFGTASFQNTDIEPKRAALSHLFQNYMMPEDICAQVIEEKAAKFDLIPREQINKLEAMRETPSLIKAYLRLGGTIGNGAFLDLDFNTVDVFVFMKTNEMVQKYKAMYQ